LSTNTAPQPKYFFISFNITNEWPFWVTLKAKVILLLILLKLILKLPSASVMPVIQKEDNVVMLLLALNYIKG